MNDIGYTGEVVNDVKNMLDEACYEIEFKALMPYLVEIARKSPEHGNALMDLMEDKDKEAFHKYLKDYI